MQGCPDRAKSGSAPDNPTWPGWSKIRSILREKRSWPLPTVTFATSKSRTWLPGIPRRRPPGRSGCLLLGHGRMVHCRRLLARELSRELPDVPIGLLNSSWGRHPHRTVDASRGLCHRPLPQKHPHHPPARQPAPGRIQGHLDQVLGRARSMAHPSRQRPGR